MRRADRETVANGRSFRYWPAISSAGGLHRPAQPRTWRRRPGRSGFAVGGRRGVGFRGIRRRHVGLLLAALQPDVIDGVLDGVEARAFGKHPAGEDAPDLAVERDLVDLDEGIGLRLFRLRPRVADARRHLQRAELHRLVDIDVEGDDAPGDLVDAGEFGDRIGDSLGQCGRCCQKRRRQAGRRGPVSSVDHPGTEVMRGVAR